MRRRWLWGALTATVTIGATGIAFLIASAPVEGNVLRLSDLSPCERPPGSESASLGVLNLSQLPEWTQDALANVPFAPEAKCYDLTGAIRGGEMVLADVEVHIPADDVAEFRVGEQPAWATTGYVVNVSIGVLKDVNEDLLLERIPQDVDEIDDGTYLAVDYNHGLTDLVYATFERGGQTYLITVEAEPGEAVGTLEDVRSGVQ